jgi:hypothetical protein
VREREKNIFFGGKWHTFGQTLTHNIKEKINDGRKSIRSAD